MIHPLLPDSANAAQLMGSELVPGTVMARRHVHLGRASFEAFAAITGDAHPLHYDAGYARSHGLRAPIAHGLLVVAVTALGATTLSARLHDSMIAMLGVQARFHAPAFVEDDVEISLSVLEVQPKGGNRCVASFEAAVLRADELLASVQHQYLLKFSRQEEAA